MANNLRFNRPTEYDPTFLEQQRAQEQQRQASPRPMSKRERLAQEFGLADADSDEDEQSKQEYGLDEPEPLESSREKANGDRNPNEQKRRSSRNRGRSKEERQRRDYVALSDYKLLEEEFTKLRQEGIIAIRQRERAEQRVVQLQQMSKQTKNILVQNYKAQLKSLGSQLQDHKIMLEEDEMEMEALRLENEKLRSGDLEAARTEFKQYRDVRELLKENTTIKNQLEQAVTQAKHFKNHMTQRDKELDQARRRIQTLEAATDANDAIAQAEQLEEALKKSAEAQKTLQKHASQQQDEIKALKRALAEANANGNSDIASPSTSPDSNTDLTISAEAKIQYESKIQALQQRIQSLESTPAPSSSSPDSTPTPTEQSNDASAQAQVRIKELEGLLKKMNDITSKREEEMKYLKDKAKERLTTASNNIKTLKAEYNKLREAYTKLRSEASQQATGNNVQMTSLSNALSKFSAGARSRKSKLSTLMSQCQTHKEAIATLRSNVQKMNSFIPQVMGPMITQALQDWQERQNEESKGLAEAYAKEYKLRRKYFNMLQELRGNIRVYCRVRPAPDPDNVCVSFLRNGKLRITNEEKRAHHDFEFEEIFKPDSTQVEVFNQVSDLILSVLDGYNVCIFAYGQTGSGKTHTMNGPPEDPGVNFRALSKLFEEAHARGPEMTYKMSVTLLEIYNDNVFDLLADPNSDHDKLRIVQGSNGMEVPGITVVDVFTEEEVINVMTQGSRNRTTAKTKSNADSSRSHLILSVQCESYNTMTERTHCGKLHLIDLAGSERVAKSGVQGKEMKEAQAINKSLSTLGNVINARAKKQSHVPFRDSKLTFFLQDSLSKNSKTLMFVQVNPQASHVGESLCSLQFGQRVSKVELGKAQTNEKKQTRGR